MPEVNEERKMLAIMAHDIKAPLSAIVDLLDVITRGYVQDIDKTKELVSRARQKAETLVAMVDDILDYTLLSDKSAMKRGPVDLYEVLKESVSTMKPYTSNLNIDLVCNDMSCRNLFVNGNYTFLLRVFNNLIMNAIKYNRENGRIAIDCAGDLKEKIVKIAVKDSGIGIPKDEIDNVFKIFERGRHARKNINGSLGLGLSLVKQIVDDHDGRINLTSSVGVGTTITVTLPLLNT